MNTSAICWGRSAGNGAKSRALTPLKTVVFPRIPIASVRMAIDREAGRADERADGVSQVLRERREEREAALGAMGFDGLCDAAELAKRQVTRLLGRHALPHVLVGRLGDVPVDLGTQLAFTSCVAAKQTEQARQKDSQGGHDRSS